MTNNQLTNYIIPTTLDTPDLDVVMLENPYTHGPFGAKGVGEMPIDGPAPAVINALRHAGFDLCEIPATPEKIMAAARVRHGSPELAGERRLDRPARSPERESL